MVLSNWFDSMFFDKNAYTFTRDVHDMFPYRVVQKDGKIYLKLNTLCVSKSYL